MNRQRGLAYLFLVMAQMGVGFNIIFSKLVMQEMPVYFFLGVRFFITAVILTLFFIVTKTTIISSTHPDKKLQLVDWGFLLAQAFTGSFLFNVLFIWGLEYTNATSAGIISATLPAMIAICAYFMLKEPLTLGKTVAIMLAMIGIVVIAFDGGRGGDSMKGGIFGNMLIFSAILPEALYSIFYKYISRRVTALGCGLCVCWFSFFMMIPLALLELPRVDIGLISPLTLLFVVAASISCAFFFYAWPKGLQTVSASSAAVFVAIMPVVVSTTAYFAFDENFTRLDALGMGLIFVALIISAKWAESRRPSSFRGTLKKRFGLPLNETSIDRLH